MNNEQRAAKIVEMLGRDFAGRLDVKVVGETARNATRVFLLERDPIEIGLRFCPHGSLQPSLSRPFECLAFLI
jgi:hypothetical protein